MDIFLRNIPTGATGKQTREFVRNPLMHCNIKHFHVNKLHGKPNAIITLPSIEAGLAFLARYGPGPNNTKPLLKLVWAGKPIYVSRSHTEPNERSVSCLAYDESRAMSAIINRAARHPQLPKRDTKHDIRAMFCGVWEFPSVDQTSNLGFITHYSETRPGTIHFGSNEAIILLGVAGSRQVRIDLNYRDCEHIVLGSRHDPSITFNLRFPPKLYGIEGRDVLEEAMMALFLQTQPQAVKKERLTSINDTHAQAIGTCFAYRVALKDFRSLDDIGPLLERHKKLCLVVLCDTKIWSPTESIATSFKRLNYEVNDMGRFGKKPFGLRFQVERLAKNGKLSPSNVIALLPAISQMHTQHGLDATCYTLRRFYSSVVQAGPMATAEECTTKAMKGMLEKIMTTYDAEAPDNIYELSKRHSHVKLIHRIVVTPSCERLEGPEPEPANRVTRRYKDHIANFMRVVFEDEDGGSVRYDPRASQHVIYNIRFKGVLDDAIIVGGVPYSFLGFSHSSLRSQACWFMATLSVGHTLVNAEQVLQKLGDFSKFRSPAKCAARIGQNFTDTNATVDVSPSDVSELCVVERNGRDFSDGVGTISLDLLRKVWKVYGSRRLLKPTALQIRFQGAKGMVSLDTRLKGERLMLRSNMKKFETEASWNLEICGASFNPLPMVLNRQFIKIFEDLEIDMSVFMDLQNVAMNALRSMTESTINAASFMDQVQVPKATLLTELLLRLHEIGLDYHDDDFLYSVIEMTVLTKLRDLKYRGRIPVEKGVTLFGIMDETGVLKEGEIYVVTEKGPEGGQKVLQQDNVVVTRSPALHPGDIQVVNAVDVPDTSPLKELSNVVVFSQHGSRDLPSQLSGGDLDGDLYNVIFDTRLIPRATYPAADYPRVPALELDRSVTQKDMSDFFVKFMESDQLGMLCTLHVQLADQLRQGTLDPACLQLASMASTAVDFSKTGIPVDLKQIPTHDRCRPDFMASSPRVVISENGYLDLEDEDYEDDDAFDGLDMERKPFRFYRSDKTLGHLYRAIDERQFLDNMQQRKRHPRGPHRDETSLLKKLFGYLKHWAQQYGLGWTHQLEFAEGVMASYNSQIFDLAEFYEPSTNMPLTETEIFAGTILGRQGGCQGKSLRELCSTMRSRFTTIADFTTMCIRKGNQQVQAVEDFDDLYDNYDDREVEALPRALACMHVAMTQVQLDPRMGELRSFRYIVAAVALEELWRYQTTVFGTFSLPLMAQ